MFFY